MADNPAVVAICNLALGFLGQDPIMSLEDNGAKAARLCLNGYPHARDTVLCSYPWNGAARRALLPALAAPPAFGHAFQYALPEGPEPACCIRMWRLVDQDGWATLPETPWKVEGRRLLTDREAPVAIEYITTIDDPAQLSPMVRRVIACRLAADIAYALTGSQTVAQGMETSFVAWHQSARSADAQEGSGEAISGSTWLQARW